ncbi:MAG: hypothetical protein Q7I94_02145 [Candidatus Contubernalis sp.]|nr:hypothetical protein [Candidatus Contubernalis sp.]
MDAFEITALLGGLILLTFGGLCLFAPERAKAVHARCLPKAIKQGKSATPCQERIICRIAGVGLLVLAFILLKEVF